MRPDTPELMCLYFSTLFGHALNSLIQDSGRMLRGCGKDLAMLSKDLLGFLLLLPGLVLGLLLVAVGTVFIGAVKLVIGTSVQVEHSVRVYCATIQRGSQAYRGGAPVPQGVPVAHTKELCSLINAALRDDIEARPAAHLLPARPNACAACTISAIACFGAGCALCAPCELKKVARRGHAVNVKE